MKYRIYDWAGNDMGHLNPDDFDTFDDAWSYIFGELTDLIGLEEEDYQEYQVLEVPNE